MQPFLAELMQVEMVMVKPALRGNLKDKQVWFILCIRKRVVTYARIKRNIELFILAIAILQKDKANGHGSLSMTNAYRLHLQKNLSGVGTIIDVFDCF